MSNARNIANLPNGDDAPIYACRAWVSFVGSSGTDGDNKTIRDAGNVSSVYESETGRYRVNFGEYMPDRSYVVTVSCWGQSSGGKNASVCTGSSQTESGDTSLQTGYVDLTVTVDNGNTRIDLPLISVAIFR